MNTSDKKRDIKSGAVEFPQFPGEDCLAHTASTYHLSRAARRAFRVTAFDVLYLWYGYGARAAGSRPRASPPASVGCSQCTLDLYLACIYIVLLYAMCISSVKCHGSWSCVRARAAAHTGSCTSSCHTPVHPIPLRTQSTASQRPLEVHP